MEKYFEKGELSVDEINNGLKNAVYSRTLFPLVCVSSEKNVGISRLADILSELAPTPDMAGEIKGYKPGSEDEEIIRKIDASEPCSIFVYKSIYEQHLGEISFFKVMSGSLKPGTDLKNPETNTTERFGAIFAMNGKHRTELEEIQAGDIGTVVKLKDTHTCDTLCDPKSLIKYPSITYSDLDHPGGGGGHGERR
ncbi:MAG: EF-Tu/IF-2/RF-3 family GTPase [Candidatus Marinimicrobia bacterium]|nr:EF-Tu/IF-2/RF-3 family GTPase [Candidatus Neomarinimicrobiota bacterium]